MHWYVLELDKYTIASPPPASIPPSALCFPQSLLSFNCYVTTLFIYIEQRFLLGLHIFIVLSLYVDSSGARFSNLTCEKWCVGLNADDICGRRLLICAEKKEINRDLLIIEWYPFVFPGTSTRGSRVFAGMDAETGALVAVTQWEIHWSPAGTTGQGNKENNLHAKYKGQVCCCNCLELSDDLTQFMQNSRIYLVLLIPQMSIF